MYVCMGGGGGRQGEGCILKYIQERKCCLGASVPKNSCENVTMNNSSQEVLRIT